MRLGGGANRGVAGTRGAGSSGRGAGASRAGAKDDGVRSENEIGTEVVDAAVSAHRALGPGLLESVYEVVLAHELSERGLRVERQVPIRIAYKGLTFDEAFRADLVVEGRVIVECRCVEHLTNAHRKQVQTYLRLTNLKLGYLLNFPAR